MDDENPENLPMEIPPLPSIPAVGPNNTLYDFQEADSIRSEVILQRLYMELGQPMSVASLCRLANTSAKLMEVRRHLNNRPYGVGNKGKDDGIVDAID